MPSAKNKLSLPENRKTSKPKLFPIVCLGASAGGLEGLELFFKNISEKSGMAFIVIQHLDPTQKGMLPELLQRDTKMKVIQIKDLMVVKPNIVHVIPPNKSLSILKGVLHLFDPVESRGLRLPIDTFLHSLSDDCGEMSVAIILSGMGSDGSSGIKAVKGKNGIVMVQEPSTAQFDSMPRNAIDSVLADVVAPPNELPEKLLGFYKNSSFAKSDIPVEIKDQSSLDKIIILLRSHTGNDFSLYKKNTIYRRIERRMSIHKIDKIKSFVSFLQENPKEVDILFKELMIGVTNFFRDKLVWEKLAESVLPDLLAKVKTGTVLRAWIPACSTGEEAYSLAIIFKETVEKINPPPGISFQIFATDLDNDSIESARKGSYPYNISSDVSSVRLNRFFISTDDGYRVNAEIREMIVFAHHNLIMQPPFTKIDFLSCRNLLIYMDTELQNKILGLFYYSLNPEGILLLGSSETLGVQSHLFSTVNSKLKVFKRSPNTHPTELFDFPSSFSRTKSSGTENKISERSTLNIQTHADQLLLQNFSPAGVLVNENGDIIYTSGRTGKYLEPSVGKANLNIFAMLRDGLRTEFPAAFRKAITKKETVILKNIKVGANDGFKTVSVTIQHIDKPGPLSGTVMIIFNETAESSPVEIKGKSGNKSLSKLKQSELEEELLRTREDMQNTFEEMQTSQEELKSANEELQSTNEELQSSNEELTTSKEEMQSLNEELQTVNAELMSKVDDFSRVSNDMKNLLNSTDIATLFLDKDLNIRRFTNQATKIFKMIKSDIGRPFTDQVSDLIYPELAADAIEVLRTLVFIEKQIPTKDGRWFSIRIMPYRTSDDRIDGLVITFFNITNLKHLEVELFEKEQVHHLLLDSSDHVIVRLSTDWIIQEYNSEAEKFFGVKRKDAINRNYIQTFISEPARKKTEKEMLKLLGENPSGKFRMQVMISGNTVSDIEWAVNVILSNLKKPLGIIITTKNMAKK